MLLSPILFIFSLNLFFDKRSCKMIERKQLFFTLGGIVLQHLLDWVKWHCDTADRLARDVADSAEPAESYNYWPAVCCPSLPYC